METLACKSQNVKNNGTALLWNAAAKKNEWTGGKNIDLVLKQINIGEIVEKRVSIRLECTRDQVIRSDAERMTDLLYIGEYPARPAPYF